MASPKPLPPVPLTDPNDNPPLTIDARGHLGDVISYSLSSRELSAAWQRPLENALNVFAQWLLQSRCIQDSCIERERQTLSEITNSSVQSSQEKRATTNTTNASITESVVRDSDAQRRELISHLYDVLQRQEGGPSHLLVCAAAPPAAATAQDLEFQVVPASSGCSFEEGVFHLPFFIDGDEITRGEGGAIISGWDFKKNQLMTIVGGSFRFRGLSSVDEYKRLVETLFIGVYVVKSQSLEINLFRDMSLTLLFPPMVQESTGQIATESSHDAHSVVRGKVRSSRKGALWSYLTKHSENIFGRVRALSHDSSPRPSLDLPQDEHLRSNQSPPPLPFTSEFKRIQEAAGALSTSPGVRFPPPALLKELAEKESQTGLTDLTPSQKTGLRSLLGWSVDHRLSGPNAFLRHQCITVLYSEHVPMSVEKAEAEAEENQSKTLWTQCIQPRWTTFRYYSKLEDQSLGEAVMKKCSDAQKACSIANCKFKRLSHQTRWITGRTQIVSQLNVHPESQEDIRVWVSCRECSSSSTPKVMGSGTWLISLGKFLELLSYSPHMARLSNPPCEHTVASSSSEQELARCRSNIIRHFAYKGFVLTFTTSPVQEVYEVRIPRVQITKGRAWASQQQGGTIRDTWQKQEQDKLRLEITLWWKGVKQHINALEDQLEIGPTVNPLRKPLPPSPPANDDIEDTSNIPTPQPTPKPNTKSLLPQSADDSSASSISTSGADTIRSSVSSLALLAKLRQAFSITEQSLYSAVTQTPVNRLNNVRRLFLSTSQAASNRLSAWEKKHTAGVGPHTPYVEPDWWSAGFHPLPNGSVIVREGEWASMIAFTLSSADYAQELMRMSHYHATSSILSQAGSTPVTGSTISSTSKTETESVVSNVTSVESSNGPSLAGFMHAFAASKAPSVILDPDDESQASSWHSPETSSSEVSRRDNPKDGSNILSLRDVLRNKVPHDANTPASKNSTSAVGSSSNLVSNPPSAFGAASLELATQQAQGTVEPPTPDAVDTFAQILRDAEGEEFTLVDSLGLSSPNSTVKASASSRKTASIVLHGKEITDSDLNPPPVVPPKDFPTPATSAANTPATEKTLSEAMHSDTATAPGSAYSDLGGITMSTISAVGTLTSSIANAMRFVLAVAQTDTEDRSLPDLPHQSLLAMESPDIDAKPHIRYDCIIGKRLKFSCTVYYAKQFDSLRRRCGIDEILIESLKQTENWAAEGGKSKSNFWKTKDDRFIIKTLVDAWNVADLQVLIELGPSYFRFMDKTAKKPSIMAKMLGFFTVEVKNMENGAIQSKVDLLIMENLFYERTISQTFDLKGIEGRKVKPNAKGPQSKTLFDGEWIEGQRKDPILLHPHSKIVLEEGISLDTDFLAQSNIMDYSLLLGVDKTKDHIACGLVDTIGSYTFAKTIEYKAKQNLRKEVTVVPPNEYRDRFVRSINSYFIACPDKWSHPGPDFEFSDRLPSIF